MRDVHITLQGKGGVGKSFVSSLLMQYVISKDQPVVAVDTDPVNTTLLGYKAFNAVRLELMENGSLIERNFDKLIEKVIAEDTNFIIDNGASSFIPLSSYIAENEAIDIISENGKKVVIHSVITGGQAVTDTLQGLNSLLKQMPDGVDIVVWINEYFGEVILDGKTFEQMKIYQNNKEKIRAVITIPKQTSSTFGEDVKLMLDKKYTFDEVQNSEEFGLMSKSRLNKVKKVIFDQLNLVI